MNIKNLSCVIFLLMLTFSCNLSKSIPNMPNVSKKMFSVKSNTSADYVGLIPFNDVITVPLNSKAKEYRFYGVSGQIVKIKQKSIENLNCYLELFDPSGSTLATNSSTSGLAEITFTLTSTGMHNLSIGSDSSANATGTYQVSINGDTGNSHPVVAMQENGDYVVAWQKYSQTTGWDVYARRYFADGTPKGLEFMVNIETSGDQMHPTISISKTGGYFAIAWDGRGSVNGQLDDDTGIYMQRFNSDGSRFYSLSELRINYLTDGIQSNPSVVEGQDGSTAFVWQTDGSATNNGIWLRKVGYDVGYNNETRVNDVLTGIHANPKVGMNNGGDFVVVWQGSSANDNYDIHYKKYNLYSSTTNAEIQANYLVNGIQSNPDVVITDDNRIVIAWQTNGSIIGNDGIYSRYIDTPAGVPVEIKANSTISNDLSYPSISMNHSSGLYNNDFVITWMGNGDGDSTGIYQRRYNIGTLSPQNPEYRMNYLINGSQEKPAIALGTNSANDSNLLPTDLGYSKFITVWQTRNSTDSTDGIYALKTRNNNYSIANELKVNANTSVSGGASND